MERDRRGFIGASRYDTLVLGFSVQQPCSVDHEGEGVSLVYICIRYRRGRNDRGDGEN